LNQHSFAVQEIAELSEILTVQKNDRALITSSAETTQYSIRRKVGGLALNAGKANTRP